MIKYKDLLLSSKFFCTEGSVDSKALLFPDKIKKNGNFRHHLTDSESRNKPICKSHGWDSHDLDMYLALESACGDYQFMVKSKCDHLGLQIHFESTLCFPDRVVGCIFRFCSRGTGEDALLHSLRSSVLPRLISSSWVLLAFQKRARRGSHVGLSCPRRLRRELPHVLQCRHSGQSTCYGAVYLCRSRQGRGGMDPSSFRAVANAGADLAAWSNFGQAGRDRWQECFCRCRPTDSISVTHVSP